MGEGEWGKGSGGRGVGEEKSRGGESNKREQSLLQTIPGWRVPLRELNDLSNNIPNNFWYLFIHLDGETHYNSYVFCLRTSTTICRYIFLNSLCEERHCES